MDGAHGHSRDPFARRKFSAGDVNTMLATGVLKDGEKVELLRGELIEMAPQGPLHWRHTHKLVDWLFRRLPQDLTLASQGPLRLGPFDEPEPGIFIFPSAMDVNDVRGPDVAVVIEVALTSLDYDLGAKAQAYAEHGVSLLWVIDVQARRTLVHERGPDGAYGEPRVVAFDEALAVPFTGGQLRLSELV
jgi:Uma2 family endonuclease